MFRGIKTFSVTVLCLVMVSCGKAESMTEDTEHKYTNRLIHETSPYLLQHAHNPVDWFPWGSEAFEKAKRQDKPIFLSIGYSTCHWCHVMAHESFENERIAKVLNDNFVSIKVDREELPGVDAVYMDFVQKTAGHGGWPMSVFLTADAKPFFGGTYFPPVDSYGRPGFESLLTSIEDAWRNRRDKILASADEITSLLQEKAQASGKLELDQGTLKSTSDILEQMYDSQFGGFGNAPKFPQSSMLSFLMVYSHRTKNEKSLVMVESTLEKMANGGIYDHLGGGFHRYSIDRQWLVPHFEKMLYDQALISYSYVQAYQLTGKSDYRTVVKEIFDYVFRNMTSPKGGFYSAEDADSEGHEGVFYVWEPKQIDKLLSSKEETLIKTYYGVSDRGNFEGGKSILHVAMPLSEAAGIAGVDIGEATAILDSARKKLLAAREKRIRPHRDEKIIAGWNGLMISSLAYGGVVLAEPEYIQAAKKSADFILKNLYKDGRLMRYYANGKARQYAVLNDYAYLIRGLIDLYQADFDPVWLKKVVELAEQMTDLFEDKQTGGFYLTGKDAQELVVRTRPDYDGAIPSGNSVAAIELIRLAELTGQKKWMVPAEKVLELYQNDLKIRGTSLTEMLIAADFWLGPRSEIVIAGPTRQPKTRETLGQLRKHFLPRTVVLLRDLETNIQLLEEIAETVKGRQAIDGEITFYLCENFVCKQPITEQDEFLKAVKELR